MAFTYYFLYYRNKGKNKDRFKNESNLQFSAGN